MERRGAYAWLADQIGIGTKNCHIGMMDERQCVLVGTVSEWWREPRFRRKLSNHELVSKWRGAGRGCSAQPAAPRSSTAMIRHFP
jgi:hypothetical protein